MTSEILIDDLEIVSDRDTRRLYELNIIEAIEREKRIKRDKDDIKRFSVGLTSEIIDEIDSIENELDCSGEKIRSASIIHGISVIQHVFGGVLKEMRNMQITLINCNISEVMNIASSANNSVYEMPKYSKKKSITIPKEITGAVSKIEKPLFLDSTKVYRMCMIYSMYTRPNVIPVRKNYLELQIDQFEKHIRSQYYFFDMLESMIEKMKSKEFDEKHINEEFKSMYK